MSTDVKHRFQTALAKFLGAKPTEERPLGSLIVSERWHLEETVDAIIQESGQLHLSLERFNQLMLHCRRRLASPHFFDHYFGAVRTVSQFEESVDEFRKAAMWLFGNFRYAYRMLATSSALEFRSFLVQMRPRAASEFESRSPSDGIEEIPLEDVPLLGYTTKDVRTLKDLHFVREAVRGLCKTGEDYEQTLRKFGETKQVRISQVLREAGIDFPESGAHGLTIERLKEIELLLSEKIRPLQERADRAKEKGLRNTRRYLTMPEIDVYAATSMRYDVHFEDQYRFLKEVMNHEAVKPLKVRYFDPTQSYVESPITKGLIECLMIRRASVTIYNAAEDDSFGKDSELAASLAQGKPVIVYVPLKPSDSKKTKQNMDDRAKLFREIHPLGLQTNVITGVAHGVIVVRTTDECARALRNALLNDWEFMIVHEDGNYKLREKSTGCVLRVVSDDPQLTHAFWTYFHTRKRS